MLGPGTLRERAKRGEVWHARAVCREGAGRQAGDALQSGTGPKTGNPPTGNIRLICMFTSFL